MKSNVVILLFTVALSGCATMQHPDPLEPMNRAVFSFNEGIDTAVVRPVARGYKYLVPSMARTGITNVIANSKDLWAATNHLLQGQPSESAMGFARFGTNTTVGLLGLFDVATSVGLPLNSTDFGTTLGVWGIEPGAYLVLPLLGPTTSRGAAGAPLNMVADPVASVGGLAVSATQVVNGRANILPATDLIDRAALDKYLFVRDGYLQRRRQLDDKARAPRGKSMSPSASDAAKDAPPEVIKDEK